MSEYYGRVSKMYNQFLLRNHLVPFQSILYPFASGYFPMLQNRFKINLISKPALLVLCVLAGLPQSQFTFGQAKENSGKSEGIDNAGLTKAEVDDGWLALFDGKSTFGWKASSKANWSVDDGVISVSKGKKGLLYTTSQFDNFEFKAEFKIPADTNSGIFIRTSPKPGNVEKDCYEINLADAKVSSFPTGSLVKRQASDDPSNKDKSWYERWHEIQITADGPKVTVSVDGKQTLSYDDPAGEKAVGKGYIGLQLNSGLAQFKSIRLKPLSVPEIFNGRDLTGWKTDQKLESEFAVTDDGELNILSGKGQIESKPTFADFIFSMKCKTNADDLNSGVFFRCIPGDLMNGYESQIQNQFKDGDRSEPVDCGTGGIFRRVNARAVNADDKQWFTKTIIANGPRIAVWVNGLQVTDWSDQRKPHKNPRKGQRLESGSIIFQGHDPTTDILLKEIKARELSPRH